MDPVLPFRGYRVWLLAGAAFLTLIGAAAAPRAHGAFGISPPFLNTDHLVPGAVYQQTIYLVQDQPAADLHIQAVLTVPEAIRSWVGIDKGFDFVIPQGARQFPVIVTVSVPKSASLGKYSGNLVFTTVPTTGGQVAIALGANVAINLTVGNDIYESYKVALVTLPSIEEGWNPRATVRFQNDGNIPEGFDSATFELYDRYGAVRLAYITKQEGFPETPPFTTKEYTIEFPTDFHLGLGDYWGSVNFYKDRQVVASSRTIFHVLPAGSLSPYGQFISFLKNTWVYWVLGVLGSLLVARRFWVVVRRHRRPA